MENGQLLIGMDAKRIVSNGTGLGNYGRTLVNAMSASAADLQLRLYAPTPGSDDLRGQIVMRPNVRFEYPQGLHLSIMRDWWRARGMVKQLRQDGVDLYHGLSGELPSGLRKAGIPAIVTIHDLIFLRHPEYYKPIDVMLYRRKFIRTLHEADRIIAISRCTRRDVLEYAERYAPGLIAPDRVQVIYQSFSPRFSQTVGEAECARVRRAYDLPAHFLLNVGTVEERKNVLLAVKALLRLPRGLSLIIVGRRTHYADQVMEFARRHGLADRVRLLHGVGDADLAAIYHLADAFVYPSRYEGFGIPIIEAISSGLPVVACTGSCLEEAGGEACLYVDPDDEEGLARAVETVVRERDRRVGAARQYIRRFENRDVAGQVVAAYRELLAQ